MRRTLVVLGAILGLLGLPACTGDGPEPSPSPSASATSPSTSDTGSPAPVAETPEEFIRRWIDVQTEMQNTGDTAEFRKLSKGCKPCSESADRIDQIYEAGGHVTTDGWTPTSFTNVGSVGRRVVARVEIENAPTELIESAGAEVQTLRAGQGVIEFTLRESVPSFVVVSLIEVSSP